MALPDRLSKGKPPQGAVAGSPGVKPARTPRRWLRRIAIGTGVLILGLVLFGYFAAPPLIKSILTTKVSEMLHRQVSVGRIAVNPFLLTVEIDDLLIRERDGTTPFIGFDQLRIDLEAESIYRRALVLREIRLVNPAVHVVRLDAKHYNFSDLVDEFAGKPTAAPETGPAGPARFSVNNIQLTGGSIDFDDRPEKTLHKIRDLSLAIPFLSNLPWAGEIFVQPAFHARVNGAPLDLRGKTKPFGPNRETSLTVKLADVDLPFYLGYLPFELQIKPVSARLDADLDLTFAQPPGKTPNLLITGKTALRDVKVTDLAARPLLSYPRLDVVLDSVDVFQKKVAIRRIVLDHPVLNAERAADGSINLTKMTLVSKGARSLDTPRDDKAPPPATAKPDEPAFGIKVAEIRVDAAKITFNDLVPTSGFRVTVEPFNAAVRNFDTAPDAIADAHLDAKTDAGEAIEADGRWRFADRTLDGTARVAQVPLKHYAAYFRDRILFDIDSGSVDFATAVHFVNTPGAPQVTAHDLSFALKDLKLRRRDRREPFLRLGDATLAGGEFDLAARAVTLGEVASHKLSLQVTRAKDGTIDLATLTPAPKPASPVTTPPPAPPSAAPASASADAPWLVKVSKITLDQYAVRFDDEVPMEPVLTVIDPIRLGVQNLVIGGKPEKAAIDLALTVNTTGKLSARGSLVPQPLAGDLAIALAGLAIEPFQPYFADKVNITVTSGEIAARGKATFALPPGGKPLFSYAGTAAVNKLATVDKQNAEDFMKWESLFFDDIRLQGEPFRLEMKEVALTDFYSRLVVDADGTLNVQGFMVKDPAAVAPTPAPAPAAKPAKAPPAAKTKGKAPAAKPVAPAPADGGVGTINRFVKIDQITLQGGTISFTDHLIKPNVNATLAELGGRVTGLLSDPGSRADVDLRGKLASQAPLSITGKINPLAGELFADIKVSFRDIELPAFTPYAGKYAGYTIEKGKLSLDLQYLIEQRKLTASNRIVIDQFTFGDKVESADATKLPVQLAIALLKDSDGRIDLDIPVTGSLDDPKFRLGKVIWGVIVNLVTKAVTAPFALIGSLFGGGSGAELSYLDFAPGSAAFDAEADKKLGALAKALRDRPALKLEIVGHTDAEKDREALRAGAFDRKVKAQKLKDMAKAGQAPDSLGGVTVEPGKEYEKYLAKAYSQEKFPKPRNVVGLEKSLPVTEMEKLMLTNIVVGTDDLRQLAMQRADAVKGALLKAGDLAPERLFLVEAKIATDAKPKGSRVEFTLR